MVLAAPFVILTGRPVLGLRRRRRARGSSSACRRRRVERQACAGRRTQDAQLGLGLGVLAGTRLARRPYHPRRRPRRRRGRTGSWRRSLRARRLHRLLRHLPAHPPAREEAPAPMRPGPEDPPRPSAALYLLALVLDRRRSSASTRRDNKEFKPQNEFKLDTWIDLPGPLDINKAVLYLVIAGVLTVLHDGLRRPPHAGSGRTACRPPSSSLYALMRDNITRGNMDDKMAREVVPVHRGALPVHLVLEPDRLHPAADQHGEKFDLFGVADPGVRDLRGDGEPLDPAGPRARSSSSPTRSRASAPRASAATSRA